MSKKRVWTCLLLKPGAGDGKECLNYSKIQHHQSHGIEQFLIYLPYTGKGLPAFVIFMSGTQGFSHTRQSEAGFSLIELSIILAVVAIILVGMLAWITPPAIDEAERLRITRERMVMIQSALISYRANFGRLPCPAKRSLIDTHPKNGEEDCTGVDTGVNAGEGAAVTCTGRFNATRKNVGVVPARTLGLGLSVMVDGWGRRFSYHVAEDVCPMDTAGGTPVNCTSSTYANTANPGNIIIRTTNPAGGVRVLADPAFAPASGGAVYVLISHGQNGSCGWLPSGVQKPAFWNPAPSSTTPNAIVSSDGEAENVDQTDGATSVYWKDTYSQTFDDLVMYQTKDQLDSAIKDPDDYLFTNQRCRDLTTILRTFDRTDALWLDSAAMPRHWPWHDPYSNSEGVLRVLWYMQEICAQYYAEDYNRDNVYQDGTAAAGGTDSRACGASSLPGPGTIVNRAYDFTAKGCVCPTGVWTLVGANHANCQ